ncbi:MAG: hypothetical protein ABSA62_12630 [Methyloceanibacter sp.]|jgi:hypothetical protein
MFDEQLFEFRCKCGKVSHEVVGRLDNIDTITCPVCSHVTDLRAEPYRSRLADVRELASELDKQARQRGEIVERIK